MLRLSYILAVLAAITPLTQPAGTQLNYLCSLLAGFVISAPIVLIPSLDDHDAWAHLRRPMDMILHGWSTSRFQAKQQWSRMSS
jgi:hypothetical protein